MGRESVLWRLDQVSLATAQNRRLQRVCGEIVGPVAAVMGASGSGKTSLLELLVGFEAPSGGCIERPAGEATAGTENRRLPLFWVPQHFALWPSFTVQDQLRLVQPGGGDDVRSAALRERLLRAFDLWELRDARPETLSGGEAARTALARGLAAEPQVLVVDEPLIHVSVTARERYWSATMQWLDERDVALVFATHDPQPVLRFASHVLCLEDGVSTYCGPVQTLYRHPPTRRLAGFLGPFNWWDAAEARFWLPPEIGPAEKGTGVCLRPEQVDVVPCAESATTVLALRPVGGLLSVTLSRRGQTRDVVVARHPRQPPLKPGMAVELVIEADFTPVGRRDLASEPSAAMLSAGAVRGSRRPSAGNGCSEQHPHGEEGHCAGREE